MDRDQAFGLLRGGKLGIAEWNQQREASHKTPDMRGADLFRVDLCGANLSRVDLSNAILRGADLRGAELLKANLADADLKYANLGRTALSGANMVRANLRGANLGWAKLVRANLDHAILIETNLNWADLHGADLGGATCSFTTFANVDLSGVANLDSIQHQGPSTVGTDTLFRSHGRIPELFLRGAGVPEALIEYLPSLMGSMHAIQFYSCFISHSSQDHEFATRLHSRMVQEKLRVWYSPQDMRGGRKILDQLDEAIRLHDRLLLVLSEDSMASDWVKYEIAQAIAREKRENRKVLFPITLAPRSAVKAWSAVDSELGEDLAEIVREYHTPDFSNWKDYDSFEATFARLMRDLKLEDSKAGWKR
jgi:hypothetical protein